MQLTNVSGGSASAKAAETVQTETFDGWTVKEGRIQGSWYHWSSTIQSAQERYDAHCASKKPAEEVPVWKKPFVFISNAASNLFGFLSNAFKTVFFCFFKAEKTDVEATEATKTAAKAKKA